MVATGVANQDTFYVDNSGTWEELNHYEYFKVKKRQNQVSEFEVKIFDIQDAEKVYFKEQAEVLFFVGTKMVLKGRINSIEYGSAYECTARGFGMESLILDKQYIESGEARIEKTDIGENIASDILLGSGFDEAFDGTTPSVTVRFEYANKLNALAKVAEITDTNWWISQTSGDDYDADQFNMLATQGDQTNPNLIAHWKMNDNLATTNVIDSVGSNNGTLTGGNSEDFSTTGKINNSIIFEVLSIPNHKINKV